MLAFVTRHGIGFRIQSSHLPLKTGPCHCSLVDRVGLAAMPESPKP